MRDFETKNLVIRKFKMEDAEDVHKYLATETKLTDCIGYNIHTSIGETETMVGSFIKEYEMNELIWAIENKKTNEVIGFFNAFEKSEKNKICKFKFGIALDYVYTGFMEEALTEICNYLFNAKKINVLITEFYDGNKELKEMKSNILENVGFTREAILHKRKINEKTGKAENKIIYSKFKDEI